MKYVKNTCTSLGFIFIHRTRCVCVCVYVDFNQLGTVFGSLMLCVFLVFSSRCSFCLPPPFWYMQFFEKREMSSFLSRFWQKARRKKSVVLSFVRNFPPTIWLFYFWGIATGGLGTNENPQCISDDIASFSSNTLWEFLWIEIFLCLGDERN